MKILITGANGYAASNIISTLQSKHDLILTSRSNNKKYQRFPFIKLDLTKKNKVLSKLEKINPDIIIHTAAITLIDYAEEHKEETYLINVEVVKTLCNYCVKNSTWLIHFSTDAVFSGNHAPYTEDSIPHPINYYGIIKLEAELIIQKTKNIKFTICRTSVIYGWKEFFHRGNLFFNFYNQFINGKHVFASQIHYGNPTYIEDIGRSIEQIIYKKIFGILHIVGSSTLNKFEFAMEMASIFNLDRNLIKPIKKYPGNAPRSKNLSLISIYSSKKLGIMLKSPKEAFKDLYLSKFDNNCKCKKKSKRKKNQ